MNIEDLRQIICNDKSIRGPLGPVEAGEYAVSVVAELIHENERLRDIIRIGQTPMLIAKEPDEAARRDEREKIAHWLERASGIESGCECDEPSLDLDESDETDKCWPCRIQDCVNKIRNGETR